MYTVFAVKLHVLIQNLSTYLNEISHDFFYCEIQNQRNAKGVENRYQRSDQTLSHTHTHMERKMPIIKSRVQGVSFFLLPAIQFICRGLTCGPFFSSLVQQYNSRESGFNFPPPGRPGRFSSFRPVRFTILPFIFIFPLHREEVVNLVFHFFFGMNEPVQLGCFAERRSRRGCRGLNCAGRAFVFFVKHFIKFLLRVLYGGT